jgi:hypothetical protein
MFANLKSIYSSKISVVTTSFSFLLLLLDFKSVVSNIGENLYTILISFIFFVVLFTLYLINSNKNSQKNVQENNNLSDTTNLNANLIKSKHNADNEYVKANLSSAKISIVNYLAPKFIFSIIIAFSILILISLFSIRNMPIYYVVIKKDLNFNKAMVLQKEFNSKMSLISNDFKCTILRQSIRNDKFLLSINGGYLDKDKASNVCSQINKFKSLKFTTRVSNPNYSTHFIKKIKYINQHFLN